MSKPRMGGYGGQFYGHANGQGHGEIVRGMPGDSYHQSRMVRHGAGTKVLGFDKMKDMASQGASNLDPAFMGQKKQGLQQANMDRQSLAQMQASHQNAQQPYDDKHKRHRRTANEIARMFKCPVDDCHKSYGSEGSLN
jgi:hypothetical protein